MRAEQWTAHSCCDAGDAGYDASYVLSVPESRAVDVYGPAERAFNHSMSAQRIVIEWVRASGAAQRCRTLDTFLTRAQFFNDVVSKFRYLDSVRKMKIEAAGDVSASYRVAVILRNLIACETQNTQASIYFGAVLPTLEEYCELLNALPAAM